MQLNEAIERAKMFLRGRAGSYQRRLPPDNLDTRVILADLARFCRAHVSTGNKDPYIAARLDGRREVWLRIQHHLHLDDQTLWLIYGGQPVQQRNDDA